MMNTELEKYQAVTAENMLSTSQQVLDQNNSNTIFYYSNN
jgi:zinc protease